MPLKRLKSSQNHLSFNRRVLIMNFCRFKLATIHRSFYLPILLNADQDPPSLFKKGRPFNLFVIMRFHLAYYVNGVRPRLVMSRRRAEYGLIMPTKRRSFLGYQEIIRTASNEFCLEYNTKVVYLEMK